MDNEITVQEELESAAAEIPADAVEEPETEAAPGDLRLVRRSVPQFSAESRGASDGFAAIRSIFARK